MPGYTKPGREARVRILRKAREKTNVFDRRKPGITYGEQHTARPLLTPDEVRNLPQNLELLFLAGQRPIVAGKLAYYADSEFRGLFDQA
jgi:type IV secretion system protein VirD4